MKKVAAFIAFLLLSLTAWGTRINVIIDERVELSSIVFRLAGAEEYVTDRAPAYISDIDSYFSGYAGHRTIEYIKEIRPLYDIGYGKIVSLAKLIEIRRGHIVLRSGLDYDFLGERFKIPAEVIEKYASCLDRFYRDTAFHSFFEAHHDMIETCRAESEKLLGDINLNWFESNYREQCPEIEVNICMANGQHNYGGNNPDYMKLPSNISVYLGCNYEHNGIPSIGEGSLHTIIHEITHGFANPMIRKYENQCLDSVKVFYPQIASKMKENGYGDDHPEGVFLEWLTNLLAIKYQKDNHLFWEASVVDCEERGFIWMSESVRFLEELGRDGYPYFEDMMPQLVGYINNLPHSFENIKLAHADKYPYIESCYPASGSSVPSNIQVARIVFSKPMHTGISWRWPVNGYELPHYYAYWSDDGMAFNMVFTQPLEPGHEYGINVPARFLVSDDGYMFQEGFDLIFKAVEPVQY